MRAAAVVAVLVGLPLIVAVAVLRSRPWHPVLDLAMTEFRVRDVFGRHTPLIGLPGRIGEYPDQGSHPGPLSFYLLAPTYRLLGSSPWAMEAGTVVIHLVAIGTGLWLACRRLGWAGLAAVAALFAVLLHGYGQVTLTQPWNPYLPLVAWMLVLLSAWAVRRRRHGGARAARRRGVLLRPDPRAVPPARGRHGRARPRRRAPPVACPGAGREAGRPPVGAASPSVSASCCGCRRSPTRSATTPATSASCSTTSAPRRRRRSGPATASAIALRHLDAWTGVVAQLWGSGGFVDDASVWRGALTLVLWLAAAVVAFRIGSRQLRSLHVVVAVAITLGTISTARIFGRPWYYLTLWAWGTTLLALGAIAWTAVTAVATAPPEHRHDRASSASPAPPWPPS